MKKSWKPTDSTSIMKHQTTPFHLNSNFHVTMGSAGSYTNDIVQLYQNVVVMRHGDRLDNSDQNWITAASRPWDPPLNDSGKERAFATGRSIRSQIGFPIHRVFVSPFLRCLETAYEVVAGMLAVTGDITAVTGPSKIKVSVEYGLCEMLNHIAIRRNVAPTDGIFSFDISKCEAALPAGTVDQSVERVYKELPKWEETVGGARARYLRVIKALADNYLSQNLLLVTHGEGVGSVVSKFVKDVDMVCQVDYCAYSHLRRPILSGENESFTAGDFVGIPEGQVGLKYILLKEESEDDGEQNYE